MAGEILDLFGLPIRPERGKGRPEHEWTIENSNKVNLLFACGRSVADVAQALDITQPTLRKHYFSEVEGRASAGVRLLGVQLARLNDRAAEGGAGSVAAERTLVMMAERERMKAASDNFGAKPKAAPKGLKDVRREAAQVAGQKDDDWGPLLHGESGQVLPN